MGNRSHLRPERTVDRNGRATTVYVAPDDESTSMSMLASIVPTLPSYGDEEDWDNSPVSNPQSWQDNEFSMDDAENWEGEEFNADDAYSWRASGFEPYEAAQWHKAEFSVGDAKEWKAVCDPDNAALWAKEGISADDAQPWVTSGYDPDDAKSWIDAGIDSAEVASDWASNNFDPSEATEWMDAGFKEPFLAADWRGESSRVRNLNKEDLLTVMESGADSQDAPMWLRVLEIVQSQGNPNETMSTVLSTLSGVNPSAGEEYANHYPYEKWSLLSNGGIEYDQVGYVSLIQSAVASRDEEYFGEDYEDDPDGEMESAIDWVSKARRLSNGKAQVLARLITAGESAESCRPFLSSEFTAKYDRSDECLERVRAAQKWALSSEPGTETDTFDQLYSVLTDNIDLKTFGEMLDEHGVAPVRSALSQGLETEAQVRNYLENGRIVGISEGAL